MDRSTGNTYNVSKEQNTPGIERRRFHPYPEYKDSGVEWLDKIPAHWEVRKVKRLCLVRRGASPRPIDDPTYFDDDGEYAWVRISDLTASDRYLEQTTQRLSSLGKEKSVALEPGELFLSIAASVGKPVITKIKCCIHDGFVYFVGLNENREYLYYLFTGGEIYKGLGKLGTQLNLNTDTIGDIYIPIPPSLDQQDIVQFLDRETVKTDALIAKKERLIELLQEKRTALITQAVTKGLDPTVPMKDSGVEWLGKIPPHWEVKRIKNVARIHTGGTPAGLLDEAFEEEGIPWVKPEKLQGDCGIVAPDRRLSYDAAKGLGIVIAGSSLVCGIGTVGKTGHAPFDVCTNQQISAITFGPKVINRYGQFIAVCLEQEFARRANKVTIAICNKSAMGEAPVCIPQAEEQRSIVSFLDRETAKIDKLISKIREAIIHLHEYRTALISSAVTGKIDVHSIVR